MRGWWILQCHWSRLTPRGNSLPPLLGPFWVARQPVCNACENNINIDSNLCSIMLTEKRGTMFKRRGKLAWDWVILVTCILRHRGLNDCDWLGERFALSQVFYHHDYKNQMNHVNLSRDVYSLIWWANIFASLYRPATVNTNTPRQHPFQKCIGFLLLFDQLSGPLNNKLLQVVRVLFHHVHDVVKDVCFPVEWTTKRDTSVMLQENKTAIAEVLPVTATAATFYE